jgi:hypothetical protein
LAVVPHNEANLYVEQRSQPGAPREFLLWWGDPSTGGEPVHPIDLLGLDSATLLLNKFKEKRPELALVLSLSRLLVPCLKYRGSGRHIVLEPWTQADLRGESLPADTRTRLAEELAREQLEDCERIVAGEQPPPGSLAEAFWEAQTDLPLLGAQFDDPQLGKFAKALYLFLAPAGSGDPSVEVSKISVTVERLRKDDFEELALDIPARELNKLFRKLLVVAVMWCSQLTGEIAARRVQEYVRSYPDPRGGPPELSADERALLDFAYGACPELGNVNIGFFYGNSMLVAMPLNHLYATYALGLKSERGPAAADLHKVMHLIRAFRERRNLARAQERRQNREQSPRAGQDKIMQPEGQADSRAVDPVRAAAVADDLEFLKEKVLPRLREADRRRVAALVEARGDREVAAGRLGITLEQFSRQWRQTTKPNVDSVFRKLKADKEN